MAHQSVARGKPAFWPRRVHVSRLLASLSVSLSRTCDARRHTNTNIERSIGDKYSGRESYIIERLGHWFGSGVKLTFRVNPTFEVKPTFDGRDEQRKSGVW